MSVRFFEQLALFLYSASFGKRFNGVYESHA